MIDIMKDDLEIREQRRWELQGERHYCVYVHTNKINGKMYVGMTKRNVKERWGSDGSGYKSQVAFWRAIQKYGWDNFEHEVVASGLTESEARSFERKLINQLNTYVNGGNGYNLVPGGKYDGKYTNRKIYQFTIDGDLVAEYMNISDAAQKTGFKHGGIFHACNGIRVTYRKYLWRYVDNIDNLEDFKKEVNNKCNLSQKEQCALSRASSKIAYSYPIYQFDLDKNLIASYNSVRDVPCPDDKDKKEYYRGIIDICLERKNKKTKDGFIWRFQKDVPNLDEFKNTYELNYKPQIPYSITRQIVQFDLDGNYIANYNMIRDAVRGINETPGVADTKLVAVCKGRRKTAYGYKWKYLEDCDPELIKQLKKDGD